MQWLVPLSDVVGDDELAHTAADAVRSGWWSAGPRVAELEERLADYAGVDHAIAVSNGTAALQLALLACGIGPGDEVVTPSLTFVAVANAIRLAGATPVFCDVVGHHEPNLDPADAEAAIGPRTKAIVPLHYGGFACDVRSVLEIAARNGLRVVEDAAHAIGATADGRGCGSLGDIGCFSFFSNKNLPIGEGGAVVTNDGELARRVRLLRSHGMTTLTWDRHRGHASTYDVLEPGFNCRLDDIRAALALVQLARLPAATKARARLADVYVDLLHHRSGVEVVFAHRNDRATAAHHLLVVTLPEGASRDDVRQRLVADRIQTSVHYPPIHTFTAYREKSARPLPRTMELAPRLLTLPLFPSLGDERITFVADRLRRAVEAG